MEGTNKVTKQMENDLAVLADKIKIIKHQATTKTRMLVSIDPDTWLKEAESLQRIYVTLQEVIEGRKG
jgi:hypothetical protein